MNDWNASVRERVFELLRHFGAMAQAQELSSVIEPIALCANDLAADYPPPPESTRARLLDASLACKRMIANGVLGMDSLEPIARALDLVFGDPVRVRRLLSVLPRIQPPPALTASWSGPQLYTLIESVRGTIDDSEPAPQLPSSAPEAPPAVDDAETGDPDADEPDTDEPFDEEPPESAPRPIVPAVEEPESAGAVPAAELVPPPVQLVPDLAVPVPLADLYRERVERCADDIAMLAAHRVVRRGAESAQEERRIWALSDALVSVGRGATRWLERWWIENYEATDPWKVWPVAFLLGSMEGIDPLIQIDRLLDLLQPRDDAVQAAAQGLWLAMSPDRGALLEDLRQSGHAPKRALAVELDGLVQSVEPAAWTKVLGDPDRLVTLAALRAAARARELPKEALALLRAHLWLSDPIVCWHASRALLLHGQADPALELRAGRLAEQLGARTLDLLVLCGGPEDLPILQATLARMEIGAHALEAVALFGQPQTFRFLAHHLEDDDLRDDAARALEILFGRCLNDEERLNPAAWEAAVGAIAPDPKLRYRLGQPFRTTAVEAECVLGEVSRSALELRLDEIAVRLGTRGVSTLSGWSADAEQRLALAFDEARRLQGKLRAGSWDCLAGYV